jgi:hypothetical protein
MWQLVVTAIVILQTGAAPPSQVSSSIEKVGLYKTPGACVAAAKVFQRTSGDGVSIFYAPVCLPVDQAAS